jgi:DNA-directed RNA polymerase subunit RPC12/RpoP
MQITCPECDSKEFVATVTGLIEVFCDPSGNITPRMVGNVSHGQSNAGAHNDYICIQCSEEATVDNS